MATRRLNNEVHRKTIEFLRCKQINPSMPGYNLMLCGICELHEDSQMCEEELYDVLYKNYMVPNPKVENNKHPVKQHMEESLKAVGIDIDPWKFMNDFINEINAYEN